MNAFCSVVFLGLAAPGAACPAAEDEAAEALRKTGLRRGIFAVLGLPGPEDPDFVVRLASGNELTVYFQTPEATEELAVRRAAEAAGLLGNRVFADRGPWERIHLADNLAGAVWVGPSARGRVPRAELLRVLHPEGRALVGSEEFVKPFPEGIDSWSHPFHGPDNNPQSRDRVARAPYATQFLAEPVFSPMPQVTVASGGRLFRAFGHIALLANQNPMLNTLVGVNGYNGTILWRRPLREGFCIHRNTLIATPDTLYLGDDEACTLIDARTGEVRDRIVVPDGLGDGKVWKWMSLEAGAEGRPVLYALVGGEEVRPKTVAAREDRLGHWPWGMWEGHDYRDPKTNFAFGRTFLAVDPAGKKILWTHGEEDPVDGRGVCMKGARIYYYCPEKFLACLDGATGRVLWKNSDPELLESIGPTGRAQNWRQGYATTAYLKCDDRYIYFAGPQRPNLVVASARDGRLVWKRKDGNLHLVLRDDGFYGIGPGGAKFAYDTWEVVAPMPDRRSCTRATGSLDSIFYRAAEGTMWIDAADNSVRHIAPMRPPCQDGVVIANGMLYWGPWMCGCPLVFYGHVGLAPASPVAPEDVRLEPGEGDPRIVKELPVGPGDWPCLMGDNGRRCVTRGPLPGKAGLEWTLGRAGAGRPTAPVTAGGMVFVGYENGVLCALDASGGREVWKAYTAGPIYAAPAVWEGRLYAGSADGRVHAFEAATGRRLWTYRVAPAARRIPVFGKLISTWPVSGGVVVQDGTVYAAAGIADYDGLHVCALDAVTGRPRWHNDSSGSLSPSLKTGLCLQGELYLDGGELRFPSGSVHETARFDLRTGRCLNEPPGQVGSRYRTAYHAYYPEYGQFVPLEYDLPDGRTLSYQLQFDWNRHSTLAMLAPPRPGEAAPPPGWRLAPKKGQKAPREIVWQGAAGRKYNAFVVAPDLLWAAGQEDSRAFLEAVRLGDGSVLWREDLPARAVRGGLAPDSRGRIFVSLVDGRVLGYGTGN